jgi:hypothetical protein
LCFLVARSSRQAFPKRCGFGPVARGTQGPEVVESAFPSTFHNRYNVVGLPEIPRINLAVEATFRAHAMVSLEHLSP